jgi:hypothetical protein
MQVVNSEECNVAAVLRFKSVSHHFCGGTEENHDISVYSDCESGNELGISPQQDRMLTTQPESFAPYHYIFLSSPQRIKSQTDATCHGNRTIAHGSQVTVLYHERTH